MGFYFHLFSYVLLSYIYMFARMVIKLCVFQALLASVAGDEVAGRFDGKFIFNFRMGN